LTTVRQPLEEMGRVAARMLLAVMHQAERAPRHVELPTELKPRASTSVPKEVTA
jgi:LacI family transcriptional regulator